MAESSLTDLFTAKVIGTVAATVAVCYYLFKNSDKDDAQNNAPVKPVEKLKRLPVGRLTVEQLKQFTGENMSRILVSVCGRIFDLTKCEYPPQTPPKIS